MKANKITILTFLLLFIMVIPLFAQYEDSLVSDEFNSGYLSNKWTIISAGDGGNISFYDSTLTFLDSINLYWLKDPGIQIDAFVNSTSSYGKYGIKRDIPEIIKNNFSIGSKIKIDIPSQVSIVSPNSIKDAGFIFEIQFEDSQILKYTIITIDYAEHLKTILTCMLNDSIVLDTFFNVHILGKNHQVDPVMYLELSLEYNGNNFYSIYVFRTIFRIQWE